MKMAKASDSEWKRVMEFINDLESEFKYPEKSDEELGDWIRKNFPPMHRVCLGYKVLLDNCCDQNLDYLEWKPEYKAMIEATNDPVTPESPAITPKPVEEPHE